MTYPSPEIAQMKTIDMQILSTLQMEKLKHHPGEKSKTHPWKRFDPQLRKGEVTSTEEFKGPDEIMKRSSIVQGFPYDHFYEFKEFQESYSEELYLNSS